MAESRLSIIIDSRDAEQKTKDMRRSLDALESAGMRATASTNGLSGAAEQQRRELDQLLGRIDPVVGKLGQLDKMEQQLRQHRKSGLLPKDDFDLYMKKIDQTRNSVAMLDRSFSDAEKGRMDFARLAKEIDPAIAKLSLLSEQQQRLNAAFSGGYVNTDEYQRLNNQLEMTRREIDGTNSAMQRLEQQNAEQQNSWAQLSRELDPVSAKLSDLSAKQERLNQAFASGNINSSEYAQYNAALSEMRKEADGTAESMRKMERAASEQDRELQQLINRLDPLNAKLNELEISQKKIDQAFKASRIDSDQYERYSAEIEKSRVALQDVDQEMGKVTRTAGQQRQALQQLPMQFTDIWVSLAAGQMPLTVLMQQGTQISDSFGGVGNALKESAKYALGLVNPFTVGAAAVAGIGVAAYQGADEAEEFNKTLIMMGNRSGVTADQLVVLSQEMDNLSGVTQRRAAKALNEVASAGDFTAQQLREVTEVALMLQSATGQSVEETVKQFASIKGDPVEALIELDDQYGFLNQSLYESVKALRDSGDETGAAARVMEEFADVMRDRASQVEDNIGWIEQAWRGVKIGASEAWDAMLGIGRASSGQGRIEELQKELQNLNSGWGLFGGGNGSERERIEQEIQFLQFQENSNAFITAQKKAQSDQLRENIKHEEKIDSLTDKYKTNQRDITALIKERATLQSGLDGGATGDQAAKIRDSITAIDARIESLGRDKEALKAQRDAEREAAKAARDHVRDIERQREVVQSLYGDVSETGKAWAQYHERLDAITESTSYAINPQLEMSAAIYANARAFNEATASSRNYTDELRRQQDMQLALQGDQNDLQVSGVGMGDQRLDRAQQILSIRQDYQKREQQLFDQYNSGDINRAQYDEQLEVIREYSDKAVAQQQSMYERIDMAQSEWQNGASAAWDNFLAEASDVAGQTQSIYSNVFNGLSNGVASFVSGAKFSFSDLATSILNDMARLATNKLLLSLVGGGGGIGSLFGGGGYGGGDFTSALAFASGGYVRGPGTGTSDSVPAMLSNGEYVINADATEQHRPLLDAINGNSLSGDDLSRQWNSDEGVRRGYASQSVTNNSQNVSNTQVSGGGVTVHNVFNVQGDMTERQMQETTEMQRRAYSTVLKDVNSNGQIMKAIRKGVRG